MHSQIRNLVNTIIENKLIIMDRISNKNINYIK
jgi:hypothetical protein